MGACAQLKHDSEADGLMAAAASIELKHYSNEIKCVEISYS